MKELQIRPYLAGDEGRLAEIVRRCAQEVNSRDYPSQIIDKLCGYFSAERFTELAVRRRIYVACAPETGAVLGTVSRERNEVYTMVVDPGWAGNGIGRQLMRHLERLAAGEGHDYMGTGASITAHNFYLKLAYLDRRQSDTPRTAQHHSSTEDPEACPVLTDPLRRAPEGSRWHIEYARAILDKYPNRPVRSAGRLVIEVTYPL